MHFVFFVHYTRLSAHTSSTVTPQMFRFFFIFGQLPKNECVDDRGKHLFNFQINNLFMIFFKKRNDLCYQSNITT